MNSHISRITGGFPSCIGTCADIEGHDHPQVVSQEVFPLVLELLVRGAFEETI